MKHSILAFGVATLSALALACGEQASTPASPSPSRPGETAAASAPDGSTLKATAPAPYSPANADRHLLAHAQSGGDQRRAQPCRWRGHGVRAELPVRRRDDVGRGHREHARADDGRHVCARSGSPAPACPRTCSSPAPRIAGVPAPRWAARWARGPATGRSRLPRPSRFRLLLRLLRRLRPLLRHLPRLLPRQAGPGPRPRARLSTTSRRSIPSISRPPAACTIARSTWPTSAIA